MKRKLPADPNRKPYKGVYTVKKPEKYRNNRKPVYRSTWELQFMKWLDSNSNVVWWSSEMTVVPYISKFDGQWHRYFVDFTVRFNDGKTYLFEIKPEKQTKPPSDRKRKTKQHLIEVKSYAINISKWEYAQKYAEKRNWIFQILTEKELKKIGIKIL
jgi:hypothetical protein